MNKDHQIEKETQKVENYADEIELIDILRVMWKWKYFILAGTLLCGLIASIISFYMSKVYSIDMVLRPGILNIGPEGKNVYIDSAENIKALIESGTFNSDILNYLNKIKMKNIPKKLEIKVTVPKNSDTIKVDYETDNIKQGVIIQRYLIELLLEKYKNIVTYYKNEFDMKLSTLKSEIDYIRTTFLSYKRNLKNIEKRIDELTSEIKLIKNNTANLIKERNKLLSENPKDKNILSALVYTNTIQQNLQLSNDYQNEISDYNQKKEDELQKIKKAENEIDLKSNELKSLQFKKDNIQNIQILQPATSSIYPIKPKKILNIALALVVGFLFFVFLSFFLEYLSRHKSPNNL